MSNPKGQIAAGIDIGANSFRLLIGRVTESGLEKLVNRLETVGLGRGMSGDHPLISEAATERALTVLRSFREELDRFPGVKGRACGTSALRLAVNRRVFLAAATKVLGMEIEVVSGEDEAGLSLTGALAGRRGKSHKRMLLVDVGGGSTELIYRPDDCNRQQACSIALGAINLTESFLAEETGAEALAAARQYIQAAIAPALLAIPLDRLAEIMASGGTATALAAIDLGLEKYAADKVQDHIITPAVLARQIGRLAAMSKAGRDSLPGLGQGRGDIIIAGALILQVLLDLTGINRLLVSDAGLLEGILLSSVNSA